MIDHALEARAIVFDPAALLTRNGDGSRIPPYSFANRAVSRWPSASVTCTT